MTPTREQVRAMRRAAEAAVVVDERWIRAAIDADRPRAEITIEELV